MTSCSSVLRTLRIPDGLSLAGRPAQKPQPAAHQRRDEAYPEGKLANPYDGLPAKLMQAGQHTFTRDQLAAVIEREDLALHRPVTVRVPGRQLGIRSFLHWAEHMEDETEHMLCLVHHFDGRGIRDASLWNNFVGPAVRDFLVDAVRGAGTSLIFTWTPILLSRSRQAGFSIPRAGSRRTRCNGASVDEPRGARRMHFPAGTNTSGPNAGSSSPRGCPDVAVVLSVTRPALGEASPS